MEKFFNAFSVYFGVVGGFVIGLLGGWDKLLAALILLIITDFITGILKAIYNKELNSKMSYKGIVKKVYMLFIVLLANTIQISISPEVPVREIVITFFICNEGISVLENAALTGIPIPNKIKDLLLQLRGENDGNKNDATNT